MFIVPFIHKITQETNFKVHSIQILTIGGKYLWEEEDGLDIDRDILESNDIYRRGSIKSLNKSIKICEIDTNKTNVNDFYNWNEISIDNTDTFCWRNYTFFSGAIGESWLTIPKDEKLGNIHINNMLACIVKTN